MKAATREFDLSKLATEGITNFDASGHVAYSEEEPNSLTPSISDHLTERMQEHYTARSAEPSSAKASPRSSP